MNKLRHLPNLLTLLRVFLGLVYLFMLIQKLFGGLSTLFWPLAACFMLIVATDLLDGRLARRMHAVTALGARLDIAADSFFVLSGLIVHNLWGSLPVWFTAVVLLKLADFLVTSQLMTQPASHSPFVFDPLGKAAAGGFFTAPFAALLPLPSFLLYCLLLFVTGLSLLSSVNRWLNLLSKHAEASRNHSGIP